MKYRILSVLLLVFAVIGSGCGGAPIASAANASPESGPVVVEDQASLVAALEAAGASIEAGDPVEQPFFTPLGNIVKVNGADVQVFQYESAEAMENEAAQVAPDGGSIGTSMVSWMDTPHFYKTGRIIVLYVGSDETVLGLLESAVGPQFAGR